MLWISFVALKSPSAAMWVCKAVESVIILVLKFPSAVCLALVSDATADFVMNAVPNNPTTPIVGTITQPNCSTPTGSVVLSGLPSGNWIINPGAITGSGTEYTVTGLTENKTHNFTVTDADNAHKSFCR